MTKKKLAYYTGFITTLAAICLWIIFNIYNSWNNTLFKNNNWESSKVKIGVSLMGAYANIFTHYALAGNKLNVSAWHGYQELFYKKSIKTRNLKFDYRLTPRTYFCLFFHNNGDTLSGIRISNDTVYPNIFFRVYKGEFIEKTILNEYKGKKWNKAELQFSDNRIIILINDKQFASLNTKYPSANILGFRGGYRNCYVDNIFFFNTIDQKQINEKFNAVNSKLPQLIIGIIVIILVILLIFLFKPYIKNLALWILYGTITLILIWVIYTNKLQYFYPKPWMINWQGTKTRIETKMTVSQKMQDTISTGINSRHKKIMFIGTSQTWGAGASDEEHSFVRIFENLLNSNFTSDTFTCINPSIPGSESSILLELYENQWITLKPDIVIINLGCNDSDNELLKKNIDKFIKLNRNNSIKTYLVLEANINSYDHLLKNHSAIKQAAFEKNILVIDLHNILLKSYDSGFLFWDFVHLTDYGHKLVANILFDSLKEEIQKNTVHKNSGE